MRDSPEAADGEARVVAPAVCRVLLPVLRVEVQRVGGQRRFVKAAVDIEIERADGALAFEATRVAPFRPRSLDVSVVLDLMIHDLDLILSIVPSEVESVEAVGVPVLTDVDAIVADSEPVVTPRTRRRTGRLLTRTTRAT